MRNFLYKSQLSWLDGIYDLLTFTLRLLFQTDDINSIKLTIVFKGNNVITLTLKPYKLHTSIYTVNAVRISVLF